MTDSLTFQSRAHQWMLICFGAEVTADIAERSHRFLEEALELTQSIGCTRQEAHQLVDYVFERPAGVPGQEVGGTMLTLAALCGPAGLDMMIEGERELQRVNQLDVITKIRRKQETKPHRSPLPGNGWTDYAPPTPAPRDPVAWIMRDNLGCEYITMSRDQADSWPTKTPLFASTPAPSSHVLGTDALTAIAAERSRQVAAGYDAAHDDGHRGGEIITAPWGALGRINAAIDAGRGGDSVTYTLRLTQAAAQIAAEIERVERALATAASED